MSLQAFVNSTTVLGVVDTTAGELQFVLAPADGIGPIVPLLGADPGFGRGGREMAVSPDGQWLCWNNHEAELWLRPLTTGPAEATLLAEGVSFGAPAAVWSPDSNYIAVTKTLPNNMGAIFIYSVSEGRLVQLSDGRSNAWSPVYVPGGLVYLSDRELTNTVGSPWGARGSPPSLASTARIYVVPLTTASAAAGGPVAVDGPTGQCRCRRSAAPPLTSLGASMRMESVR